MTLSIRKLQLQPRQTFLSKLLIKCLHLARIGREICGRLFGQLSEIYNNNKNRNFLKVAAVWIFFAPISKVQIFFNTNSKKSIRKCVEIKISFIEWICCKGFPSKFPWFKISLFSTNIFIRKHNIVCLLKRYNPRYIYICNIFGSLKWQKAEVYFFQSNRIITISSLMFLFIHC